MKHLLTGTLLLLVFTVHAQRMTWDNWETESKSNKRLLPKYGGQQKTAQELAADEKFIQAMTAEEQFKGDRTAASNHMISLGFNYLYRGDIKTAMYRFNQAYLLDTANIDVYWGYGAVYMTLGNFKMARRQYDTGLSIAPNNTHLLTDLATYFMQQHFVFAEMPENKHIRNPKEQARVSLDSAVVCLRRSYELDPKDQNTTYKLSTVYYYADDCDNAWKYYTECKALGGQPITEAYTTDLKKKCKKR